MPGYYEGVAEIQHGNDVLDGGADTDILVGGGKDDGLFGGTGNDKLWGDDQSEAQLGGQHHGNDYLDGGDGKDQLVGGIGDDVLLGDARPGTILAAQYEGDDILYGDAGETIYPDKSVGYSYLQLKLYRQVSRRPDTVQQNTQAQHLGIRKRGGVMHCNFHDRMKAMRTDRQWPPTLPPFAQGNIAFAKV